MAMTSGMAVRAKTSTVIPVPTFIASAAELTASGELRLANARVRSTASIVITRGIAMRMPSTSDSGIRRWKTSSEATDDMPDPGGIC